MNVVFTGHYHAQDITMERWDDETFIFDVETGSFVTYPCPLREVKIAADTMLVTNLQEITSLMLRV